MNLYLVYYNYHLVQCPSYKTYGKNSLYLQWKQYNPAKMPVMEELILVQRLVHSESFLAPLGYVFEWYVTDQTAQKNNMSTFILASK